MHHPMSLALARVPDAWTSAVVVGLGLGIATAVDPLAGLAAAMLLLAGFAAAAPTAAWVAAAIVLAVGGRGLVPFGGPEALALLAVPVSWVALGLGLYRYRSSALTAGLLAPLGLLVATAAISTLMNGGEPARPLFYIGLLVTPFALVGSMLVDRPDERWQRNLVHLLTALILLQVPFAYWQAWQYGIGDLVQGTFAGSEVGAHTTAAVSALGAIWIALRGPLSATRVAAVLLLLTVPLLAAANQVIIALPLALIAVAAFSRRRLAVAAGFGLALALALFVGPGWNSEYARSSIENASYALKADAVDAVVDGALESPGTVLAGQGAARTVSHASFLSAQEDPTLEALGLAPSEMPESFNLTESEYGVSVKRPESSAIGIFGDLGVFGLLSYGVLFGFVFNRCRQRPSATGQTAAVGLVMALILGYLSDWLEQPGFMLPVALLAGLALSETLSETAPKQAR